MPSPAGERAPFALRVEHAREALFSALVGVFVVFLMFFGRTQPFNWRLALYGALVGLSIYAACHLLYLTAGQWLHRREALPRPVTAAIVFFLGGLLGWTVATLFSHTVGLVRFRFATADLTLALAIGGSAAASVGLVFFFFGLMRDRLRESVERLKEAEFAEKELEVARLIQKRLLPPAEVEGEAFRVSARTLPARFVAGDFYDVFHDKDGTLGLVVADVLGKGIGASLIMASVKAVVPFLSAGRSAAETLSELNRKLAAELAPREFVALCFARYDPRTGRLEFANAGLPDPYRLNGSSVETLAAPGPRLPLGVRPAIRYESIEVTLRPEESVLFLTDGLPEARNREGDPFGYEALARAVASAALVSGSFVDNLIDAVRAATSETLEDDWTVLRLERL